MDLVDRHAAELAEEPQTPADEAAEIRARSAVDEPDVAAHASASRPELDLERTFSAHAGDQPRRRGPQRGHKATEGASDRQEMERGAER